ncbi:MAG: hypothetical protein K2X77_22965 [Candidatus Obscuribacterales bacterium]|jgi:thioredoxin-like negative regulator of GroEL|nr:hypothetical protein [Candidatus Obscuribacterales bacterium]
MTSEARVRETAALAISAYSFYRNGFFHEAQLAVQEVLNLEPMNFQAKLFLAACLQNLGKTEDAKAALRAVYENSKEEYLREKAQMGMADLEQATSELVGSRKASWINIPSSSKKEKFADPGNAQVVQ